MKKNFACNCCDSPPATRIVIQFVSFDRTCSNSCDLGDWNDWLTGPFFTRSDATGSLSLSNSTSYPTLSGTCTYEASYNRNTTAFLQLVDTHAGFLGPYDCPCSFGVEETTSSSYEEICTISFDDTSYQNRCYMTCNGGGSFLTDGAGGAFNGGGGEFGGGGASGSWGTGTNNANYSDVPQYISAYINGGMQYMTQQQIASLVEKLIAYEQQTGNQLVFVITPNNPNGTYDPFALAQQYGVGKGNGVDNGIVIFVHPQSQNWQVATGYGMEADITDALSNQIMSQSFGSGSSANLFSSISDAIEGFTGIATPNSPNGGVGNGEVESGPNCPSECPPYLAPSETVRLGNSSANTLVVGCVYGDSPEDSYEETTNYNCEEVANCPVPSLDQYSIFAQPIRPINNEPVYGGESAACLFEDETVSYPEFPVITKLVPEGIFNSGYVQLTNNSLPENQGYLGSTFRFVRGNGSRFRDQSEQHVKWRIAHNPTATCYLKVWFVIRRTITKRNLPPNDFFGTTLVEWLDGGTYEWNPSTDKCILDGTSIYDPENIIYGQANEMILPMPNVSNREYGITDEIFIKKVSVIEGYTPDDPPAYSDPPERVNYGFFSRDLTINPLDCIQCGIPKSQGGSGGESWNCAYKFIPELVGENGPCGEEYVRPL